MFVSLKKWTGIAGKWNMASIQGIVPKPEVVPNKLSNSVMKSGRWSVEIVLIGLSFPCKEVFESEEEAEREANRIIEEIESSKTGE